MNDRTLIAAMALQGLLTNRDLDKVEYHDLAGMAVAHADCLLETLGVEAESEPTRAITGPVGDPSPSLRDMGVSGRAAAPLERMGVTRLAQLAVQSRADIATVKGVSTDTMKVFDRLLADNALGWDWKSGATATPAPEPETVSDDECLEDVL